MASRVLPRSEWQSFFDRMAKALRGKRAQVEIIGLRLGDQIQAKSVPLLGITFDPKDDLVEIAMEGLDHLIHKPASIAVLEGIDGLSGLEIVDSEQLRQIITLTNPLRLSAPTD
ncbi:MULTISPECIES: DUF5335 family protein [Ensifer]|uniref:DUF5335 family protein n=1 Tax=Ensifer TaxID=106591 RepID=UPI000DC3696F|nr:MULTISPECIES: DUF5335 family protein [Ensifer]MCY1746292.1 DUF5335 family protein [Ensifer sp. SL37]RAS08289.1 hypothetical protein DEU52_11821 [Ensifer adhaerens]